MLSNLMSRIVKSGRKRDSESRRQANLPQPQPPRVTVCIPAYKSGSQIHTTLASVQAQSYTDFKVEIAVEPTGPDAIDPEIRHEFNRDPRFRFVENTQVLGWAGNVDGLLTRTETELVTVLPHDDIWEPEYLYALISALDLHPSAAVAYPDIRRFGIDDVSRTIEFDNTDLSTRLYSYYLQGAEAHSWRGVIRRQCLPARRVFPQNRFLSFAVECEFVQHLLCEGPAIRVPTELYRKRGYPVGAQSVSRRWLHELSAADQSAALHHHRARMLGGIPALPTGKLDRDTVLCAAEIAMLHRGLIFAGINPSIAHDIRGGLAKMESRLQQHVGLAQGAQLAACLDQIASRLPRG